MNEILLPDTGLLFMKVGLHAGETLQQILERKQKEYDKTGMIFWGYGGSACHPRSAVQPFGKLKLHEGKNIFIIMEEIDSHHPPSEIIANQYSEDGIEWKTIPDGIVVRGSRYAVVMDEIKIGSLDIDLSGYQVASGPSSGKFVPDYLRGHVDKACIEKMPVPLADPKPCIKHIAFYAKMKPPFAVFTRKH
jgi:hypothetical protein